MIKRSPPTDYSTLYFTVLVTYID